MMTEKQVRNLLAALETAQIAFGRRKMTFRDWILIGEIRALKKVLGEWRETDSVEEEKRR